MVLEAIEAAIKRDPNDGVAAAAMMDAIQECGLSPLAATRRVNRLLREAKAAKWLADARDLVERQAAKGGRLRATIRRVAGLDGSQAEIVVVAGGQAPTRSGEPAYHTFRGKKGREGGICQFPGSARKAGYKTDYHPSTLTATVGADWVHGNA